MTKILWKASTSQIENSNLYRYEKFLKINYKTKKIKNYKSLLNWSIKQPKYFWSSIWDFAKVYGEKKEKIKLSKNLYQSKFLFNSKLNFAENMLRKKDADLAITFKSENGFTEKKTWKELYNNTSKIISFLKTNGIKSKDRVAAYLPNIIGTVECFLATSSIGAIWSSCSPDFGTQGVIERFSQIDPKILIVVDRYYYNGKEINVLSRVPEIIKNIKSIKKVLVINYPGKKNLDTKKIKKIKIYKWKDILKNNTSKIEFKKFDFEHELAILYSSGTTGKPKCICHRAGGVLLQHLKEHQLHCDIKPGDKVFYFTTCGWMMWNWLVSNLAIGATIILYDGSSFFPNPNTMWDMVDELGITHFGTSAKFIDACRQEGLSPKDTHSLASVKTIFSTGSPLVEESFDYVYEHIKTDVQLSSISGGTDIISCFAGGNPTLPVHRGELQCVGLGMDVAAFDDKGNALKNEKGELVCRKAFPSMPIYFWNDADGQKYHNAYFDEFPSIWHHGDFIEVNEHGGVTIFGRSDATLNPGGVRIGTAEIYRVVDAFKEVSDSLVVGQSINGDERAILFVMLNEGSMLNEELISTIKKSIRSNCTPRHVPAIILQTKDIPYTINGKKVEIAVKKIIHGEEVTNQDALANPESLELYKNMIELQ